MTQTWIRATHVGHDAGDDWPGEPKRTPCRRCGKMRNLNTGGNRKKNERAVCKDCWATLTPSERALWA